MNFLQAEERHSGEAKPVQSLGIWERYRLTESRVPVKWQRLFAVKVPYLHSVREWVDTLLPAHFWMLFCVCTEFLLCLCTPLPGFMKQVRVVAVPEIMLLPATLYQCSFFQGFTIQIDQLSLHFGAGKDAEGSRDLPADWGRVKVLWICCLKRVTGLLSLSR